MNRPVVLVGGVVGVGLVGACQPLERTRGFGEGEIHLRVVADGAAVPGAVVEVIGAPRMARTDGDGRAVLTDLVAGDYAIRVGIDDDGDLLPDRGALRTDVTIREAVVAGRPRLTTYDLGDVAVFGLGRITGVVEGIGDDELGRVVVVRRVPLGGQAARDVLLPVDGVAGVDADGSFSIERLVSPDGVTGGQTTILAMTWPKPTSTDPVQQAIAASRPTRLEIVPIDVDGAPVAITMQTPAPSSVSTTIELAGALPTDPFSGLASFVAPGTTTDVVASLSARFDGLLAPAALLADVPPSVFDLQVQFDGGEAGRVGLVAPLEDATLLPVAIGLVECAAIDGARDCDGDGVEDSVDADVDGDGVADVDEPTACVGVGRGVDDDGDCLCGLADPFPGCASNDPTACSAPPLDCD